MEYQQCPQCGHKHNGEKYCPNCGYHYELTLSTEYNFYDLQKLSEEKAQAKIKILNDFEIKDDVLIKYKGNDLIVEIPQGIKIIGNEAFKNCKQITKIVLPDTLIEIGDQVFYECSNLENIVFPSSLKTIGKKAFYNCWALDNVVIPNCLTEIKDGAFLQCRKLSEIGSLENVILIGNDAFQNTGIKEITISNRTKYLGNNCFSYCHNLTTVTFLGNVDTIEDDLFSQCEMLTTVNFKGNFNEIGSRMFFLCHNLTKITLPYGLKKINEEAFYRCTNLKEVVFKGLNDLEIIDKKAFYECSNLENIVLPSSLKTIGAEAFYNTGIKKANLPSVVSIDKFAFSYSKLEEITFGPYIETLSEGICLSCKNLKNIKLPSNLKTIDADAFSETGLTTITFPKSLTEIGRYAFFSSNLTSIFFQQYGRLETIGYGAFNYCPLDYRNQEFIIPDTVKSIEGSAFKNCDGVLAVSLPSQCKCDDSSFYKDCFVYWR